MRKEKRGEEEEEGEGKEKRKKTKLESQMHCNLLLIFQWKKWWGHPSTRTQEHAASTGMQGPTSRASQFKDRLLFAELLWATP